MNKYLILLLFNCNSKIPPIKEQPKCDHSVFTLPEEGATVCCKKSMVTTCGLTVAFCDGKVTMYVCQKSAKCVSGPECERLPDWMEENLQFLEHEE